MNDRSPLAPPEYAQMPPVAGVRIATGACGIRDQARTDLCLIELAPGTTVAGVLTRSLTAAAPVDWCRKALKGGRAQAIVVNSGNANAFTGRLGAGGVRNTVAAAASLYGCRKTEVFVASTGVIGEPLPDGKITRALPGLRRRLSGRAWKKGAEAIMTTDTFPKLASRSAEIAGTRVTINGMAKGSGMIAPDMATMLAFIVTDAKIPAAVLHTLVSRGTVRSFNSITVDGDTSTSDTVLLCATGQAKHRRVSKPGDAHLGDFRRALDSLMVELAQQIVRDGEGASKFITIAVSGAVSERAARRIGLAIGNSPLVKTAIAGEDANWGRIVMAVGKAGEKADRDRLMISVGGVTLTERGGRAPDYDETPVARHMKGREIDIAVDVGVGKGRATVWTCDLTHGYISINADYRS